MSEATPFQQEVRPVVEGLQSALRGVLKGLPGGHAARATDLSRLLGIGFRQAWQTHRFVTAASPLAEAVHLPLERSFDGILNAALRAGATESSVSRARKAWTRFDSVVRTHAGDRTTFDTLVTNAAGGGSASLDRRHKRSVHRSARHLWGIESTFRFATLLVRPSPDRPGKVDAAALAGSLGMKRLHPGVVFHWITVLSPPDGASEHAPSVRQVPLADGLPEHGPLVPEFCSRPLPPVRVEQISPEVARCELTDPGIGMTSAVDLVGGRILSGLPAPGTPGGDPDFASSVTLRAPCRALQIDILYPGDAFAVRAPTVATFIDRCQHAPEFGGELGDRDRLPLRESAEELRTEAEVLGCPDWPRYGELLQMAVERLECRSDGLRGFRCRVEYPIVQTTVRMSALVD